MTAFDTEVHGYVAPGDDESPGAWVRRAVAGDQLAWSCLVNRYNPMVWSIARGYRLSDQDASDVVQTTWLRLVENLDRIREPDSVGSWLGTTARNECTVYYRRQVRQGDTTDEMGEVIDLRAAPDDALLVEERDAALWAALKRMPERCQRLLRILASDPPPTYKEVGAALDMPVGSIGPVRGRCLEKLRQCIASHLPPDNQFNAI